ncbi:MAG: NrdH-redoxin [Candidatus Aminicenantes bacterium]|nr:NrdH-redoxin [Candidatus Aminicenantes bacterium]
MVKIYSTPTCTYCNIAKKYLRDKGVKFSDYNVAVDLRRAEEMLHKSRQQGVPVIDFNGKIIVGFDKPGLDREIAAMR